MCAVFWGLCHSKGDSLLSVGNSLATLWCVCAAPCTAQLCDRAKERQRDEDLQPPEEGDLEQFGLRGKSGAVGSSLVVASWELRAGRGEKVVFWVKGDGAFGAQL